MAKEKSTFNEGNLPFEVLMKHDTKLTPMGIFDHLESAENIVQIEDFEKIPEHTGWISKILTCK